MDGDWFGVEVASSADQRRSAADLPGAADLVERDEEVAELAETFAAARGGAVQVAVIEGGPGTGKSRLLGAARHLAVAAGMRVLAARGLEFEREVAFGVAVNLLGPALDRLEPQARASVFDGAAARAAALFGAGADRVPGESVSVGRALARTVRLLMANLAGPEPANGHAPLVIIVDDAHWCDRASLRFLAQLCGGMEELPIAIVLAVREPVQPNGTLGTVLTAAPMVRMLRLRPLSGPAVELMVRREFGDAAPAFAAALRLMTGGNPFYLRELARQARREGISPTAGGVSGVRRLLPRPVVQSVLSRLGQLPAPAGALASAAAVLGDGAALRHAALLAEVGAADAGRAADALADAHILRPGEPLAFRDPLTRSVVYGAMPALARSRAHRMAAGVLDAEGGPTEDIAAHLLACGPGGDPRAVQVLRTAAAQAAERGRPQVARRMLLRALAEPPPRHAWPGVVQELAVADALTGAPEAVARVREALDMAGPERRVDLLRALARLLFTRSEFAAAAQACSRALAELPAGDPRAAELAVESLAIAGVAAAEPPSSASALLEAMAGATGAGHLLAEPGYLAHQAALMLVGGRPAADVAATARAALDRLPVDDGFYGIITGFAAVALISVDDYAPVRDRIAALLGHARAAGSVITVGPASHWLSLVCYREGDLPGAISAGQQALAVADAGWDVCAGLTAPILVHAHLDRGDCHAAARALPPLERFDGRRPDRSVVRAAGAHLALAAGKPEMALAELLEVGDLAERGGYGDMFIVPWRPAAALAAAAAGDHFRARELATAAVAKARALGAPRRLGIALRVAGAVQGGPEGLEMTREAVTVLEGSPARLELAHALVSLGMLQRRQGQRAASRDPLHRGLELARNLEARPLAERAQHELLAAGGRRRRSRARAGAAALTPTELDIAELAASGLSTAQIADKLSVTAKTVNWHLGNSYRKLGITSRGQLTAVITRAGADS